ncbi:rCG60519, partial [Rattus norvegicus]
MGRRAAQETDWQVNDFISTRKKQSNSFFRGCDRASPLSSRSSVPWQDAGIPVVPMMDSLPPGMMPGGPAPEMKQAQSQTDKAIASFQQGNEATIEGHMPESLMIRTPACLGLAWLGLMG